MCLDRNLWCRLTASQFQNSVRYLTDRCKLSGVLGLPAQARVRVLHRLDWRLCLVASTGSDVFLSGQSCSRASSSLTTPAHPNRSTPLTQTARKDCISYDKFIAPLGHLLQPRPGAIKSDDTRSTNSTLVFLGLGLVVLVVGEGSRVLDIDLEGADIGVSEQQT